MRRVGEVRRMRGVGPGYAGDAKLQRAVEPCPQDVRSERDARLGNEQVAEPAVAEPGDLSRIGQRKRFVNMPADPLEDPCHARISGALGYLGAGEPRQEGDTFVDYRLVVGIGIECCGKCCDLGFERYDVAVREALEQGT